MPARLPPLAAGAPATVALALAAAALAARAPGAAQARTLQVCGLSDRVAGDQVATVQGVLEVSRTGGHVFALTSPRCPGGNVIVLVPEGAGDQVARRCEGRQTRVEGTVMEGCIPFLMPMCGVTLTMARYGC